MNASAALTRPRLIVEAKVIRKCPHCNDSRIRNGIPVEGNCPACDLPCPDIEDKGIVFDTWKKIEESFNRWWGLE